MSELSLLIDKERDNLKSLIKEFKEAKILKILLNIVSKVNENNKTEFYDFIEEMLISEGFFKVCAFNPLLKKINKYFKDEQIIEMEEYILNKLGLAPGEKILSVFNGVAVIHKDKVIGNMFLTNKRILGVGKMNVKLSPLMSGGLISEIVSMAKDAHRDHVRETYYQSIDDRSQKIFHFASPLPLNNVVKIQKSAGAIEYIISVKEIVKDKVKERRIKIQIIPKPMRNETGKDFQERRTKILDSIEDMIHNIQTNAPS